MRLILTFCLLLFQYVNTFSIPTVMIDDNSFGQLGFAGNYAGISNIKSTLQFESTIQNNNILMRQNDSANVFEKIAEFNGNITSSCRYKDFVYFAGEFQHVNDQTLILANHIIQFDTQTNGFQTLNGGLDGPVYSIYCDETDEIIYIGGNFTLPIINTTATSMVNDTYITNNANNVIVWNIQDNSWNMLPWKGFNGPVYTITKNKKSNTILFGGRFDATGDGQYFNSNISQIVTMGSPTSISSGNGALFGNNSNANNIVCPAKSSPDTVGQPWYLQEGVPGYWDANFANPVEPTVFRLSNTQTDRGTISFNVLALGLNEYFNLSYVDPVTQQTITCSEDCTLSNATYQDFAVINSLLANGIRININSWFGSGGGLGYVQIYQSDISVHPHLSTNDNSQCNPTTSSTQTTVTGNWKDVYVYGYYQTVLVADVSYSELSTTNTSIVYEPNIPAQGQYEVYATTPGCVGSSNCFTRTQVEYQLQLSPGFPVTTVISDQNVYDDKRVLLYSGFISPVSSNFRPSITLRPAPNATKSSNGGDTVQIMADSIEFVRNVTAAPLVSVLEYSPANATNTTAISWKPLNQQLPLGSTVYTIDASNGDNLYIGGLFSSPNNSSAGGFKNIVSYSTTLGELIPLDGLSGGINGKVSKLLLSNSNLYVAGEFNSTATTTANLNHIAQFNTAQKTWIPLGDGVDGPVTQLLLSTDNSTLTISGLFNNRYISPNSAKPSVRNALWSITNNTWIERSSLIVGQIATMGQQQEGFYYAGSIFGAQTYRADIVTSSHLNESSGSLFIFNDTVTVTAGVTWINKQTNQPYTIIASSTSNSSLVSIYSNSTNNWIDIDTFQGKVNSLATFGSWLYVGGQFSPVQGRNQSASLAIYDLSNNNAAIGVHSVTDDNNNPGSINVIKVHPDGKRVLIGGDFTKVGLLDCDAVCVIDPFTRQWDQVAIGLSGRVNDMITSNNDDNQKVIIFGNLNVQNQPTTMASLSNLANTWVVEPNQLPGTPVTATGSTNNEIIVAGASSANPNDFYVGSLNGQTYTSLLSNLDQQRTNISQLLLVPISSSSSSYEQRYPSGTQDMLLAVGNLNIKEFGNASAALYDGATWYPYLLTTQLNGQAGSISKIIHVTAFNGIKNGRHYLSVAAVILISIAISTGILFTMSAVALLFLFKQHKNARGPDDMPPWTPSNRLIDAFGLFGTGSLGAATIAAARAGATGGNMAEASTATGRNLFAASAAAGAGPSNTATSRFVFQHDDGDMGVSPTTTIVNNPIPITAAAAAAGILSFDAMVASAKSNTSSNVVSETHPKLFYAKYPFKAQEFGELSLEAGDTLVVTDTSDNIWWLGYKDGGMNKPISGVFPSNYIKS